MSKSDKIPDTFIDRHDRDAIMRLLEEVGCDGYISKYRTLLIATKGENITGIVQYVSGALRYYGDGGSTPCTLPREIVPLQKTRMPYDHL